MYYIHTSKKGKGVKIMNNEEWIRDELTDYGVEDNLFDLALYYATELARYVVFSSSRYRNPGVPEAIYNRENQLDPYIEKLTFIYDTLDSLSDETVEFLRNTSKMTERYGIQNSANHRLLNIQKQLDTIMTKCVPCRNIEYEKVRLGEDSDQYRRLLYLRKIVDENEFLSNEYLNRLIDILNYKRKVIEYQWCTEEEYTEKYNFIQTYNLSERDIEYMISYLEKKNIFKCLEKKEINNE